jgi:two-component system sensor histidine kinase DesK
VADDGRGGRSDKSVLVEQGGLTGMRERLRALGGTLEVETRAGTRLLASLPVAEVPA